MNNIVDNLQPKEDLTYNHVYNKLLDLKIPTTTIFADNKAYKSVKHKQNVQARSIQEHLGPRSDIFLMDIKGKGKAPRRELTHKGPSATTKECTYCKEHLPTAHSESHT